MRYGGEHNFFFHVKFGLSKICKQKNTKYTKSRFVSDTSILIRPAVSVIRPAGADLGEGGADAPSQGFDPLPTQRVPPLVLFKKLIF